jgi:two-component system response regulator WspF
VLAADGHLRYRAAPSDTPYRPSVDVLFESVARHARGFVAAVVLTGMGRDGARGLRALRQAGAMTIVQDRATSAIYGMPKAALALDGRHAVLPVGDIAARLLEAVAPPDFAHRSVRRG